jgi:hypothetical protein
MDTYSHLLLRSLAPQIPKGLSIIIVPHKIYYCLSLHFDSSGWLTVKESGSGWKSIVLASSGVFWPKVLAG